MDWAVFWTAVGSLGAVGAVVVYLVERRRDQSHEVELTVEDSGWLAERGMTYEAFLRHLIGLDHEALAGLSDKTAGNETVKAPVFEKSQDTWGLVVFRGSLVVGYWSCFSVSERLRKKLDAGKMYDSELTEEEIRTISEPGPHDLYFEMFGIRPSFERNRKAIFRLLAKSLAGFAAMLGERRVEVRAVYANGYSEEGAALCRSFGLQPVVQSVQGGSVYRSSDIETMLRRVSRVGSR